MDIHEASKQGSGKVCGGRTLRIKSNFYSRSEACVTVNTRSKNMRYILILLNLSLVLLTDGVSSVQKVTLLGLFLFVC